MMGSADACCVKLRSDGVDEHADRREELGTIAGARRMPTSDTLRTAFMTAIGELEGIITSDEHAVALARVRDAGLDVLDEHAMSEGLLEARDDQIAAQVELLARIEVPLLQVSASTLCVPLIGEFDALRTTQIIDRLLKGAVARRVSAVVIDLTGALFRDVSTAVDLARLIQALRLIGVRGALSGIQPGLAPIFADIRGLRGVPCFADLAGALASELKREGS